MKLKATKKEIKEAYYKTLCVGYCDMQNLLRHKRAFAYSAGVCGWACDYYDINGLCISTGYSPIGNRKLDYKLLKEYENKAFNTNEAETDKLLAELLNTIK